jgi:hypothetical protein
MQCSEIASVLAFPSQTPAVTVRADLNPDHAKKNMMIAPTADAHTGRTKLPIWKVKLAMSLAACARPINKKSVAERVQYVLFGISISGKWLEPRRG